MQLDLKWLLPVVAPFALWTFARAFWAFAGLPWDPSAEMASATLFLGLFFGACTAGILSDKRVKWVVHIGRKS